MPIQQHRISVQNKENIQLILQVKLILGIGLYFVFDVYGIIYGLALSYIPHLVIFVKEFSGTRIDFALLKPRKGFIINNYAMNLVAGTTPILIICIASFASINFGNSQSITFGKIVTPKIAIIIEITNAICRIFLFDSPLASNGSKYL